MSNGRVINVDCQCGTKLFKYYKSSRGRLIKLFLEHIRKDYVGVTQNTNLPAICPACQKEIGTIQLINGRLALKLNQGTVKAIRL
ncbi:MAG: hypothetical protein JEZ00_10690 [Anaerolineaceae bacterium]|nr:hypothetical protein [Anaerolineaceae bacterium]